MAEPGLRLDLTRDGTTAVRAELYATSKRISRTSRIMRLEQDAAGVAALSRRLAAGGKVHLRVDAARSLQRAAADGKGPLRSAGDHAGRRRDLHLRSASHGPASRNGGVCEVLGKRAVRCTGAAERWPVASPMPSPPATAPPALQTPAANAAAPLKPDDDSPAAGGLEVPPLPTPVRTPVLSVPTPRYAENGMMGSPIIHTAASRSPHVIPLPHGALPLVELRTLRGNPMHENGAATAQPYRPYDYKSESAYIKAWRTDVNNDRFMRTLRDRQREQSYKRYQSALKDWKWVEQRRNYYEEAVNMPGPHHVNPYATTGQHRHSTKSTTASRGASKAVGFKR